MSVSGLSATFNDSLVISLHHIWLLQLNEATAELDSAVLVSKIILSFLTEGSWQTVQIKLIKSTLLDFPSFVFWRHY